jgi:hypothetical protein
MWFLAQRLYREPEFFERKISTLLAEVNSLKRQILAVWHALCILDGFTSNLFSFSN